ncbi:Uncharacterised protein [Escherichia coli]|uniref:Uncharacterized protein n=1 Tax=Escherichia coli TaxID=562 RepID=A0A377B990_ECOLX|nr:Uncharacterised protein [Escherichia coli]
MNIQFEGIRQFTPCMIFTSIDANVFRIVLAAMNFAFANFIDRRQQGIDIDADLTFAVSLYSFAVFIIFPRNRYSVVAASR